MTFSGFVAVVLIAAVLYGVYRATRKERGGTPTPPGTTPPGPRPPKREE